MIPPLTAPVEDCQNTNQTPSANWNGTRPSENTAQLDYRNREIEINKYWAIIDLGEGYHSTAVMFHCNAIE